MPRLLLLSIVTLLCQALPALDDVAAQSFTHRITGLCYPERVEELKEVLKDQPKIALLSVDYEKAEARVTYNPREFSRESLGHVIGRKGFGTKAPLTVEWESLKKVDIEIVGLDCKGCCLGTYNILNRIDGVEQASVDFKTGHVVAMIDPAKTNSAALEAALARGNVKLKNPPPAEPAKK